MPHNCIALEDNPVRLLYLWIVVTPEEVTSTRWGRSSVEDTHEENRSSQNLQG